MDGSVRWTQALNNTTEFCGLAVWILPVSSGESWTLSNEQSCPSGLGYCCSVLGSTSPHSVKEGGTHEGLALLLQIKRMTWICGLSSLTASFKLLILKQDKQRINNLAEHREPDSSQGKGNREASAASLPGGWVRISPTSCPAP